MKELMSGNEAIARGAYEHGITFASAYPGTPSTEIMEAIAKYDGVYAEWSPNEKVAVEVGIGAALGGARALVVMKHVGVNVAADPLFTVSYTGIEGGLVIISADDPTMHSSQNEQDNRNYARSAKIPMLEPSDSSEAKEFIKIAFKMSEEFDTPVFLRSTTRVSHSKSVVELEEPEERRKHKGIRHDPSKYVMVPDKARQRRIEVEKRMEKLLEFAETFPENRMEINDTKVGIITAGMPYNYVKDAFPNYSYLKLGMVHPLPRRLIREFASKVEKIYVVEELDPFIEEQVRAMGIEVVGKEIFPYTGEFDPGIVETALGSNPVNGTDLPAISLPSRPPNLCPGCPHRGLFYVLGKLDVFVTGDIGCYTLAFMKPLEGIDSCICMGASIGMAHGMDKVVEEKGKVVGVLGDSTFIHSGITPLLNMVYNKSNALVVICDNSTTAMTGMQEHPATGFTLQRETTKKLDFVELAKALGVENVRVIDPFDIKNTRSVIKEELVKEGPSLVISQAPCALLGAKQKAAARPPLTVDPHKCTGCRACIGLGCPPISWKRLGDMDIEIEKKTKKQEGIAIIDSSYCNGCTLCQQLCGFGAIGEVVGNE
ncbi:MAG TPA: indolepyruvate ferredoxin oxidoreductase subunit alpha [Syntrophales bacterium]|nr:indolepyruvate ferredoxin oxidoreductase subunit alpha [Syntrophales bacterium]HPQ45321.1 indolepyruvate ferredoxin oxidoreductase subunit alpha [Syntrophales bacterium]